MAASLVGAVSDDGSEPILTLTLLGSGGASVGRLEVEAVVDTGFDGELTLPLSHIQHLGYTFLGTTDAILADGSGIEFAYFSGVVSWHDNARAITVLASGETGEPLIGMELLSGNRLTVDAIPGGEVTISPL